MRGALAAIMAISEQDLLNEASNRLAIGPVPDWVVACSFSADFRAKAPAQATFLLLDRQVHAERREIFVRMVTRLETMEAVQHYSQWRLEFSAQFENVTLHSVKIRR